MPSASATVAGRWAATSSLICALLAGTASAFREVNNFTTPASFFFSRPDLQPPFMNVSTQVEGEYEDGYIFIAPYQGFQSGPYIYDKKGNVVWSGFGDTGPFNAHNMHVCQWDGSDHICMFQGNQELGYARGHDVILDTNYRIVKTIESRGDIAPLDQHEFRLINGGSSALVTVYHQVPYDLSRLSISGSQGWVMDSIFQEINTTDNSVVFEWNSLNHVAPWYSYVYPKSSDVAGDGLTPQSAWDYFHINSIDKSELDSNYIISARHMSTIFKINSSDGSIIWRLQAGGDSDFNCLDFNFGFQHDAQIRYENQTHMILSLYDNASNNFNHTAGQSAGKIIMLDYEAGTARLVANPYFWPHFELRSASQGNTQVLTGGNVFNCYGDWPMFSEHAPNGKPVWAAQIGPFPGNVMVYRAYSYPWKSIPEYTRPALWTYSKTSEGLIAFYVSWNGCTEVDSWNFYAANDIRDQFVKVGNTKKIGFETLYTSDTHFTYAFVEALDKDGKSLRNSTAVETYIPGGQLATNCDDYACPYVPPPPPPLPPAPKNRNVDEKPE